MRSKPKVVSLKHRELLAELSFLGQPTGWDLNLDPLHYSGPAERAGGEAWLAGGAGAEVAAGQEDDVALPLHADDALRGLEGFHRSGRLGVLGSRGCARLLLRGAGCCLVRPCTTLQVVASSVLAPAHLHHCRQDAPPQQAAPYTHLLQLWIHVTLSLLKTLGFAVKQLLVLDEPVVVLLLLLLSLHLAHHPLQVLRPLLLPLHQVHQQARQ